MSTITASLSVTDGSSNHPVYRGRRAPGARLLYLLAHICFPLGELVGYAAFVEMLQSRAYRFHEILELPIIRAVLVLLIGMLVIEVYAGRSGSFNLTRLFRDDWAFIASNTVFCTAILIQPLATFRLLYRESRQQRHIIFNARYLLGIVSCTCALVGPCLVWSIFGYSSSIHHWVSDDLDALLAQADTIQNEERLRLRLA